MIFFRVFSKIKIEKSKMQSKWNLFLSLSREHVGINLLNLREDPAESGNVIRCSGLKDIMKDDRHEWMSATSSSKKTKQSSGRQGTYLNGRL